MSNSLDSKIKAALTVPQQQQTPDEIEFDRKRALLAKVQQMRQDNLRSKGRVFGSDPGKGLPANRKYVWVNRNEHRVVDFQGEGYTICRDAAVATDWKREDGTHQWGDLILMEIDLELWEALKLADQVSAVENVEGAAMFQAFAEKSGIPVTRLAS